MLHVRSKLLEILLLVTLRVALGGVFVVGTLLGRRIATVAFLTLLIPPVGRIRLRTLTTVALEVAGSLMVVTLVAA